MEVRCEQCQARYRVADERIGPKGLTMKCGKCGNTFRVALGGAAAAKIAPPDGARPVSQTPAAADRHAGAGLAAAAPTSAAPAPAASAAPPAEDGPGRTMMFQTGSPAKGAPAGRPTAAGSPAQGESGATMVFGQPPVRPGAKPGSGPGLARRAPFAAAGTSGAARGASTDPALAAVTGAASGFEGAASGFEARTEESQPLSHEAASGADGPSARGTGLPDQADAAEAEPPGTRADGAQEPQGTFDRAPPKGLLIGVAAGLALLLVLAGALVAWKQMGHRTVPPGALEALAAAQAAAEKDSLASISDAEAKAKDALDQAGPRARFSQGAAALAQIEVQWADALADQALLLASGSQAETDEAKRAAADARVGELTAQAKAKLKAALDVVSPALKADARSPDLELALAEYYRAQKSTSSMNRELRKAQALKADEARISLVQGEAFAQDPDDADKALPRLKAALAASPQSARIHFRAALAHLALHADGEAAKELHETLRLSPQHERAKLLLEQIAANAGK